MTYPQFRQWCYNVLAVERQEGERGWREGGKEGMEGERGWREGEDGGRERVEGKRGMW